MQVVEASFTGVIRTVFILIGVFVLLRFLGRLMIVKRNLEKERQDLKRTKDFEKEKQRMARNYGKTEILSQNNNSKNASVEDVDYEPLDK